MLYLVFKENRRRLFKMNLTK